MIYEPEHLKDPKMDVSKNSGTPKSSILIGFSIINYPFWGTTIFGNTQDICDIVTVSPNPGAEAVSETLFTAESELWKYWKGQKSFVGNHSTNLQWIHQFILIELLKKADCCTILFSRPGQSLVLGLQLFFTNAMEAQRNHTRPPSCLDWKNPVLVKDRGLYTGIIWYGNCWFLGLFFFIKFLCFGNHASQHFGSSFIASWGGFLHNFRSSKPSSQWLWCSLWTPCVNLLVQMLPTFQRECQNTWHHWKESWRQWRGSAYSNSDWDNLLLKLLVESQ